MSTDAYQILGLDPKADAKTVEQAYWKRARELARERTTNPAAGHELEELNTAYQTLAKDFVYGTRNTKARPAARKTLIKRFVFAAVVAGAVAGGIIAGMGFRTEVSEGAKQGYDQSEASWNDTIQWLQELGTTPTPPAPGEAKQPNQGQ